MPAGFHRVQKRVKLRGPFVAAAPIVQLIAPKVAEIGIPDAADLCRVSERRLRLIVGGGTRIMTLDLADRLITDLLDDPSAWYTTPGLDLLTRSGRPLAA